MTWEKAIKETQLKEASRYVAKVNGQPILLISHNDEIHAVSNQCPHLRLPLQKGKITEDNDLICPFHKSRFDLNSGTVKEWSPWPKVVGKFLGKISKCKPLPVYQTKIEDGFVWVKML